MNISTFHIKINFWLDVAPPLCFVCPQSLHLLKDGNRRIKDTFIINILSLSSLFLLKRVFIIYKCSGGVTGLGFHAKVWYELDEAYRIDLRSMEIIICSAHCTVNTFRLVSQEKSWNLSVWTRAFSRAFVCKWERKCPLEHRVTSKMK